MKLFIMQFSPISSHFITLWSKYYPQHPVQTFIWTFFLFRYVELVPKIVSQLSVTLCVEQSHLKKA
jgi:hypothetical protein